MNSSALIVVDVQNAFIEHGTLPVPNGKEEILVINRIVKAFQYCYYPRSARRGL